MCEDSEDSEFYNDVDISEIKGLLSIILEDTPLFEEFQEENQIDLSSSLNTQWLETVSSEVSKETDLFCKSNTRGIPQKLLFVLRECVLMHRWCEAAQVLARCPRETRCDLQFAMWKVGMEILYSQFPENCSILAERLMKLMNLLPSQLIGSSMQTEYLLMQTMLHDTEKAMRAITTVPSSTTRYRLVDTVEKEKYYQNFLLIYKGLLWYKLWIKIMNPDNVSIGLNIDHKHAASSYLEKMTNCFKTFYQNTISFEAQDIVIVPHVRTLEHYQKFDEAKELLQKYCSLNPKNPNAHKYYYNFLCRRNSGIDEQLEVLKILAIHVPSDPLVLTLCEHLQTKNDLPSCLTYLFDLLDYDCWKNKPMPWKKLVSILEKMAPVNSLSKCLHHLWSQRKAWWPSYHFLPISVPNCVKDTEEKELYVTKAILALFLNDPQLNFYIKAVEKLSDDKEDKDKIASVKTFLKAKVEQNL